MQTTSKVLHLLIAGAALFGAFWIIKNRQKLLHIDPHTATREEIVEAIVKATCSKDFAQAQSLNAVLQQRFPKY